jgi:YVTN family beta-propeller protein
MAGARAYAGQPYNDLVSVIDVDTNTVLNAVPVGHQPGYLVVAPGGERVYVPSYQDRTVSVIGAPGNVVTATVPVGLQPVGLALSADGARLYVGVQTSAGAAVAVVDIATNSVVANTVLDGSQFQPQPVVSPDGARVYVAWETLTNGGVSVIDTATNTVTATVLLSGGSGPRYPAISPDGRRLYVSGSGGVVIDTTTNAVVTSLAGQERPVLSPDGARLYMVDRFNSNVDVYATSTNSWVATVRVDGNPNDMALTPDGGRAICSTPPPTPSLAA